MKGQRHPLWRHGPILGSLIAIILALSGLGQAIAPDQTPPRLPSGIPADGEVRTIGNATPTALSGRATPDDHVQQPTDTPINIAEAPSSIASSDPTLASGEMLFGLEDTAALTQTTTAVTLDDAIAQLQMLQEQEAMPDSALIPAPVQPVDGGESEAPRPTHPVARSLTPLQVGANLPGMPEYLTVGRTYAVACETPGRNIPTTRVRFVDYVRNVLPNEWVVSWPSPALDAGAIAAKQFGWYTAVIERKWRNQGYPFDVVDSTCDQVYRDASADPRTDAAIQRTWDTALTRNGRLLHMFYRNRDSTCGSRADCMGQVETAVLASSGYSGLQILARYFGSPSTNLMATGANLPQQLPPVPTALKRPAPPVVVPPPVTVAPQPTDIVISPFLPTTPAEKPIPAEPTTGEPQPTEAATSPVTPTHTLIPPTPTQVLPTPTITPIPPTATPVPLLPNLVGMGENQAREVLARLGIRAIFADYQGREQLGPAFDTIAPYTVISHTPAPGTPVRSNMVVTLGIRAP